MSGGLFDYDQYRIQRIIDDVDQLIRKNGKIKTDEELKDEGWYDPNHFDKYPEDRYHTKYPDEIIETFKQGLYFLKKAGVYAQRIDWFVSGDDGEESFFKRLKEEIKKIEDGEN